MTACSAGLSEEERSALAKPLAQFLKTLHQTPTSDFPPFEGFHSDWINSVILLKAIEKNFNELSELKLLPERKALEQVIAKLPLRPPVKEWLVHGDFYVRHLLIGEGRQLAGVIDWGDLHVRDPAIDLAIAHSFLPASAHSLFKEIYGEISDETWGLAKLRAIHSSVVILLFGYHSGDPALVDEGSRSLRLIAKELSN